MECELGRDGCDVAECQRENDFATVELDAVQPGQRQRPLADQLIHERRHVTLLLK
jgi:hypothetical protein